VQRKLSLQLHPDKHRLVYYVSSRAYTALFGLACVNSWRGVWSALDYYTGVSGPTVAALTAVSVVALAAMRALRNVTAPPFVLVTDNHDNYFQVPTMFHTVRESACRIHAARTHALCQRAVACACHANLHTLNLNQ